MKKHISYDNVNASKMCALFFFLETSAPHKKFASYYESCNKHKTQVRIYSIPFRLYHDWKQIIRFFFFFYIKCLLLNEYLTCNDSSILKSQISEAFISIGSLNSPGKIIKT